MWPAFKILIIASWLVVMSQMVRKVYFPEGSQLAEVPARVVLKLFLEQGTKLNALILFKDGKKIGHASLNARQLDRDSPDSDFQLYATGGLDKGGVPSVDSEIGWRLDLRLLQGEHWGGLGGQIRMPSLATTLDFHWEQSEKMPRFELKQNGQVTMNEQLAAPFVAQAFAGQGSAVIPGGTVVNTANAEGLIRMKSREGILVLAGQKRRGYVLEFTIMETYQAKAFFTEAGELALVELPNGYRLLESTIHNLEPDLDEEGVKPGA